jgi:hypothetical protein
VKGRTPARENQNVMVGPLYDRIRVLSLRENDVLAVLE